MISGDRRDGDKMKYISLNNNNYNIIDNYKDCINVEEINSLFTDYFYEYDYILGDYSYGKLRLKGFYDSNNKKKKKINDISSYKNYLKDFCAFECPYFLIKKQINVIEYNCIFIIR